MELMKRDGRIVATLPLGKYIFPANMDWVMARRAVCIASALPNLPLAEICSVSVQMAADKTPDAHAFGDADEDLGKIYWNGRSWQWHGVEFPYRHTFVGLSHVMEELLYAWPLYTMIALGRAD